MYRRATKGGLIEGGHIPLPKKAFPPCRGGDGQEVHPVLQFSDS